MSFSFDELFPGIRSYEFLGFVTGILSVLLLLPVTFPRLQYTNWIFSIVSAAVYFYLFKEWTLYGNMALQVPFILISAHGLWYWRGQLRGVVDNVREVATTYASAIHWRGVFVLALLAEFVAYPLLDHYGDASPLWDGFIFTISIAAIYLQLRKYVQSWYLWILVDLIAVPFHLSQERGATALLYFAYGVMCVFGYLSWKKEADTNEFNERAAEHIARTTQHLDDKLEGFNYSFEYPWER